MINSPSGATHASVLLEPLVPVLAGSEKTAPFFVRVMPLTAEPDGGGGGFLDITACNNTNRADLFVFDPATGGSTDLGKAIGPGDYGVRALTVGRDGKIYGGTGYYEGDAQFFVYDPAARRLLSKRAAIGGQNYINALTTGADGKIYGGTGNEGRLFVYNPADGSLVDKGSDMEGWGVSCASRKACRSPMIRCRCTTAR